MGPKSGRAATTLGSWSACAAESRPLVRLSGRLNGDRTKYSTCDSVTDAASDPEPKLPDLAVLRFRGQEGDNVASRVLHP
jgi:hypothetical protein